MAFEDSEIHPVDYLRGMQRVRTHHLQIPSCARFLFPHRIVYKKGSCLRPLTRVNAKVSSGQIFFFGTKDFSLPEFKSPPFARQDSDRCGKLMSWFNANTMCQSTTSLPCHLPCLHMLLKQSIVKTPLTSYVRNNL